MAGVRALAFDGNNNQPARLLSVSEDSTVKLWALPGGMNPSTLLLVIEFPRANGLYDRQSVWIAKVDAHSQKGAIGFDIRIGWGDTKGHNDSGALRSAGSRPCGR